ncbi:tol-pal system protein YbgF [Malonomonas rubra]|uniref:tol-pal system protein YbgF n=1 Tax=Malonomonas rubra TaxID=57040 RepID=UPI0026ECCCCF|nr:tol-pal system protein YbgF [Malonomonas rubra]
MRFTVLSICLLVLFGCVPPSENQLRMEKDLAEMKRRLAQLEVQQVDSQSSEVSSSDTLQRQLAEVVAGLDTLRVDFQSIDGRIDDLGQSNQQLVDDLQLNKEDFGLQLTALNSRLDELEQGSAKLAGEVKELAAKPAPEAPQPVEVKPEPVQESPEQMYQRALDLIRKENQFAEGRKLLEQFVAKYPEHDLYVNALYWNGEALFGEKKYEMAILQLQDVISKYPTHPKAAAAMLKQALAFEALGDPQNARTTMQKLIDEYPNSEQVEAAQKFLAQ